MKEKTTEDFVTIGDLAQKLNMDKSNALKFAKAHGFADKLFLVRSAASRNQEVSALSRENADALIAARNSQFLVQQPTTPKRSEGLFFVVALVPGAPIIRVVWANDYEASLAEIRDVAPTAEILWSWPGPKVWEPTVQHVVGMVCQVLNKGGYNCSNMDQLHKKLKEYFLFLGVAENTKNK
jgi:hypothetical protein